MKLLAILPLMALAGAATMHGTTRAEENGRSLDSPCPPDDLVCIAANANAAIRSQSGSAAASQYKDLDSPPSTFGTPEVKPNPQAYTASSTFDGKGWTFDVFYCGEPTDQRREIASKLRDKIAGQRNLGKARVQPWPAGKGPSYQVFHPFEIRITDRRRTLAINLKRLLDPVIADSHREFDFLEVGTDFPYYISVVVCPDRASYPFSQ